MFNRTLLFSLLFLSALPGLCASSQVSGNVLDSQGAPVPFAGVLLQQTAGAYTLHVYADAAGRYQFDEVAPGTYLLDAAAQNLVSARARTITVEGNDNLTENIRMTVAAVSTQVNVTAAALPLTVDQTSKQLDVVIAESAQKRGIFELSEALNFVPGLRVSTTGGPGAYTEIQTRGLPYQDTAVLIDGSPLRDPTSPQDEASAFISQLLLVDTARVEVLQGSGSSLYGTNAVSGTINILTAAGAGPFHGDIDVQGGGLGLFEGVARIAQGIAHDRFGYSFGIAHLNETQGVDGVGAARDWSVQGGAQYAVTPGLHAAVDVFGTTGYAQTSVTPSSLSTSSGVIQAIPVSASQLSLADASLPYQAGNATFLPSLGDPDSGVYSHFLDSSFRVDEAVTPKLSYRVSYGLLNTERNNTDGPAGPTTASYFPPAFNTSDRYEGRVDTLNARLNYLFTPHNALSIGYEWTREHYFEVSTDQNPVPASRLYNSTEAEQRFQAVYIQDQIRAFHDRLEVLLSGRWTGLSFDQPSFAGGSSPYAGLALPNAPSAWTGDASVAYFIPSTSTKLRAHVGNSFRMPSLYERFGGYFYGGSYYPLGDPELSPERATSGDFGFDQYLLHEKLKFSATYYYSRLQQIISYFSFPPTYVDPYGRTGGYQDTGGGFARGVEVSGEWKPSRHTTVRASYTYTDAKDRTSQFYTGTGVDPLQVPRILPDEVKIVAMQTIGKRVDLALDFDGGNSYLFPLYGNDYSASTAYRFDGPRQLGLAVGYSVPLTERSFIRFYSRISNALGQDFYEDGFRTPGRWAVGGLHLSF